MLVLPATGLLLSIFYFSWIPDPALQKVSWLPGNLSAWADRNSTLRTGVPFIILGAVEGIWLLKTCRPWRDWGCMAASLAGVVILAETGQLFIPRRVFDWRDLAWGTAASVLGLLPSALMTLRRKKLTHTAPAAEFSGMSQESELFYFLGVPFWNEPTEKLLRVADLQGGLLTVPSAPSLAQMRTDRLLQEAYQGSDWAVVDGGYVALTLRLVLGKSVRRISGLQILQKLIRPGYPHAVPMEERRILWVVPNGTEKDAIRNYLLQGEFDLNRQHFYLAPFYRSDAEYADEALLDRVKTVAPDWIILCIGGGKQEKLGWFLRNKFEVCARKPVILCTGGAISFLTGTQANIPTWADRLYLGWLLRVFSNPRLFGARYLEAAWRFPKLIWMSRKCLFDSRKNSASTTIPPAAEEL